MSEPRIYVACLSCYNSGRLFGEWFTLDGSHDTDDIWQMIGTITNHRPGHEEYGIHDHEGLWSGAGEYPDVAELARYAELVAEHCVDMIRGWWEFREGHSIDIDTDPSDYHCGEFETLLKYAEETGPDMYPEAVAACEDIPYATFNYRALADDMRQDGVTIEGGHVWDPTR